MIQLKRTITHICMDDGCYISNVTMQCSWFRYTPHTQRNHVIRKNTFFNWGCDCQKTFNFNSHLVAFCCNNICSAGMPAAADKKDIHTHGHTCTLVNESLSSGEYSLSVLSRSSSLSGVRGRGFITSRFYRPPTQRLNCIPSSTQPSCCLSSSLSFFAFHLPYIL